uniref:Uncharacterized protein n=1 Tax=Fagus sylvatica TaxID=28930 RepID=A0A2N9J6E9_FAGSY
MQIRVTTLEYQGECPSCAGMASVADRKFLLAVAVLPYANEWQLAD